MRARAKEETIVAIDSINPLIARNGARAKIFYVLTHTKKPLRIEDIAELTGMTEGTAYVRMRDLFNAQMVELLERKDTGRVYRLNPAIAIHSDARKRSISER